MASLLIQYHWENIYHDFLKVDKREPYLDYLFGMINNY